MLRSTYLIAAFLCGFWLSGCTEKYQAKEGWVPEGYMDSQLSETDYLVSYQTYRKRDWPEIKSLALYRAAEIGKANAYKHFSIKDIVQDEYVEAQAHKEVTGFAVTQNEMNGGKTLSSEPTMIIPAFVSEHTVRTISFVATFQPSDDNQEFSVSDILSE